jgi:hypothetical protein
MFYKTEKGYELKLIEKANITIFGEIARAKLPIPKPPIYIDEEGRELENPFHPIYHDALAVYDLQRHQIANDAIIKNCVELITKVKLEKYEDAFSILNVCGLNKSNDTLESWYLKNYVLTPFDIYKIVENTLLTETLVSSIFNSIRVTRDGIDIHRANVKNAIQTHIETDAIVIVGHQLVSPLDEIKAAQFSMINWQEWLRCEVGLEEKATAVALYRLDRIVETHSNDVVQIHQEKEARKKNKG